MSNEASGVDTHYGRAPQGRIAMVIFQFGLGEDWLKGAGMAGEPEGTISTPRVDSLAPKKL